MLYFIDFINYNINYIKFLAEEVWEMKAKDWQALTNMTRGAAMVIERVRLVESGIAVEGEFELPPLARLSGEDQVFVMAFMKCDGSIKEMERVFGISYPTVKSRLSRIAGQLQFVENITVPVKEETLAALERGEISAQEAIERMSK
jgi:hypothetical protein